MIVLGSRSPRRFELLSLLVGQERIIVRPPAEVDEAGFEGLHARAEITDRLRDIARTKNEDVAGQLRSDGRFGKVDAVLTADTVIVARDESDEAVVLGQPPNDDTWRDAVREWFDRYLLRRPHEVHTAVCISTPDGNGRQFVTSTEVAFRPSAEEWLEWYLQTEEPRGKAGGYALQGAGSLFVDSIHGSPSCVIGLPLQETADLLRQFRIL